MFQSVISVISPIHDTKGNDTVNVVSTPYFPDSPFPAADANTKLCLRLFEDSSSVSYSSEWADLYGNDSSSNGAFHESCPDGCRCQVCHYADLYGHDSSSNDWTADSSSNDWTTDSSSNDWTADSSSNGAFRESSCPDGCRCQVCHYADLYGCDS